jgi:hypothetical protein
MNEINFNLAGKFWRFKVALNKQNMVKLHHGCEKSKLMPTKFLMVITQALIN